MQMNGWAGKIAISIVGGLLIFTFGAFFNTQKMLAENVIINDKDSRQRDTGITHDLNKSILKQHSQNEKINIQLATMLAHLEYLRKNGQNNPRPR